MKEAIPCWTVAAKDRVMTGSSWVLETRTEGGQIVARITSKTRRSVIDIKEGEIKVRIIY